MVTPQGIAMKRFVISPSNYNGQSLGVGFSEPLLVADAASYIGTAIQIKAVASNGFFVRFPVGGIVNNGNAVKVTVFGS